MKIKKILLCALLLVLLTMQNMNNVLAVADWDVKDGETYVGSSGGGGGSGDEGEGPMETTTKTSGGKTITREYSCEWDRTIGVSTDYELRVYNMQNVDVIESDFVIRPENLPIAGTAIGLNVHETKTLTRIIERIAVKVKKTTVEPKTKTKKYYKCEYTTSPAYWSPSFGGVLTGGLTIPSSTPSCGTTEKITTNSVDCPEADDYCVLVSAPQYSYSTTEYYETTTSTEYDLEYKYSLTDGTEISSPSRTMDSEERAKVEECMNKAVNFTVMAMNWYVEPTYELEMSDSNDINGDNTVTITQVEATNTKECYDKNNNRISSCRFKHPDEDPTVMKTYDKRVMHIYYQKGKTCINVKSGDVSYKNKTQSCGADEFEIKNDIIDGYEHWHYFIPLNTKSAEGIQVKMKNGSSLSLEANQCLYVMRNHPGTGYVNLIKPKTGMSFKGDFVCLRNCSSGSPIWDTSSEDYQNVLTNGCSLTSTISLPVKQEFYNESVDGSKINLKGFNFYYKPINVNDPFPNGISTNSLWTGWNAITNNNPDISNSYEDVSYIAVINDVGTIKDYTKTNKYTKWDTMNTNGTSQFISNYNIVSRNEPSIYNGYKLGCGPLNEKEYLDDAKTIKNQLYIKGCDPTP